MQNTLCKIAREIIKKNDGTKYESYAHIDSLRNIIKTERLGEFGGYVDSDCLKDCPDNSIYTIHNHPGNSRFSLKDARFFLTCSKICAMITVGHQGNVYVMRKLGNETLDKFYNMHSTIHIDSEEERVLLSLKNIGVSIKEV